MSVPGRVAIVAMGRSASTYLHMAAHLGGRHRIADQTWAINAMGGVIEHDLLFHMDDCRIQEARSERDQEGNIAAMLDWLKTHPAFMTSAKYDDYPGAIEYPLEKVIRATGSQYFNNTVAYAAAYAVYIGVKQISIWGADYSYPDVRKAERGRGCLEFWIGYASARGISIQIAGDSSLMDANVPESERFYGYDASDIELVPTDGGPKVIMHSRETLPTADEIERRYCHDIDIPCAQAV